MNQYPDNFSSPKFAHATTHDISASQNSKETTNGPRQTNSHFSEDKSSTTHDQSLQLRKRPQHEEDIPKIIKTFHENLHRIHSKNPFSLLSSRKKKQSSSKDSRSSVSIQRKQFFFLTSKRDQTGEAKLACKPTPLPRKHKQKKTDEEQFRSRPIPLPRKHKDQDATAHSQTEGLSSKPPSKTSSSPLHSKPLPLPRTYNQKIKKSHSIDTLSSASQQPLYENSTVKQSTPIPCKGTQWLMPTPSQIPSSHAQHQDRDKNGSRSIARPIGEQNKTISRSCSILTEPNVCYRTLRPSRSMPIPVSSERDRDGLAAPNDDACYQNCLNLDQHYLTADPIDLDNHGYIQVYMTARSL